MYYSTTSPICLDQPPFKTPSKASKNAPPIDKTLKAVKFDVEGIMTNGNGDSFDSSSGMEHSFAPLETESEALAAATTLQAAQQQQQEQQQKVQQEQAQQEEVHTQAVVPSTAFPADLAGATDPVDELLPRLVEFYRQNNPSWIERAPAVLAKVKQMAHDNVLGVQGGSSTPLKERTLELLDQLLHQRYARGLLPTRLL
jgi:hypothetical protein